MLDYVVSSFPLKFDDCCVCEFLTLSSPEVVGKANKDLRTLRGENSQGSGEKRFMPTCCCSSKKKKKERTLLQLKFWEACIHR